MTLTLKCDIHGTLGFVETFKPYVYNNGVIHIKALANVDGYLPEPMVSRGGVFVPASQIDEEMGIAKYIKAKKPFYSILGTGDIVADLKVAYDLKTKLYIPAKSDLKLYGFVKNSLVYDSDSKSDLWTVQLRRFTTSSEKLDEWLSSIANTIAQMGNDREAFLKSRFGK